MITVWESREAFDRFREGKLLPTYRELAGDEPPPGEEPEVNQVAHALSLRQRAERSAT